MSQIAWLSFNPEELPPLASGNAPHEYQFKKSGFSASLALSQQTVKRMARTENLFRAKAHVRALLKSWHYEAEMAVSCEEPRTFCFSERVGSLLREYAIEPGAILVRSSDRATEQRIILDSGAVPVSVLTPLLIPAALFAAFETTIDVYAGWLLAGHHIYGLSLERRQLSGDRLSGVARVARQSAPGSELSEEEWSRLDWAKAKPLEFTWSQSEGRFLRAFYKAPLVGDVSLSLVGSGSG